MLTSGTSVSGISASVGGISGGVTSASVSHLQSSTTPISVQPAPSIASVPSIYHSMTTTPSTYQTTPYYTTTSVPHVVPHYSPSSGIALSHLAHQAPPTVLSQAPPTILSQGVPTMSSQAPPTVLGHAVPPTVQHPHPLTNASYYVPSTIAQQPVANVPQYTGAPGTIGPMPQVSYVPVQSTVPYQQQQAEYQAAMELEMWKISEEENFKKELK